MENGIRWKIEFGNKVMNVSHLIEDQILEDIGMNALLLEERENATHMQKYIEVLSISGEETCKIKMTVTEENSFENKIIMGKTFDLQTLQEMAIESISQRIKSHIAVSMAKVQGRFVLVVNRENTWE